MGKILIGLLQMLSELPAALALAFPDAFVAVLDAVHLGSALSLRSFARLGSALSVLDFMHLGSCLSLRSYARCGSSLSVL